MKRKLLPLMMGSLSMVLLAQHSTGQQAQSADHPARNADRPATQPAAGRRAMGPIVSRLLRMQNAAMVNGEISEDEWKRVETFMQQNSPDRLRQLNRLPDEKKPNVKRAMVGRFRMLEEIRKSDPELYDIWVQKLQLEDDRFTLIRELRRLRGADPKEIEAKIRNNVSDGVHLELAERQHRLETLERAVADEKAKLADDRKNEDALVNDEVTRTLSGPEYRIGEGLRRPPEGARPEGIREASAETPTTAPDAK